MKYQDEAPVLEERHVRSWSISNSSAEKNRVIEEVIQFLSDKASLSPSLTFKCRLCMDEAITNAITHGCEGLSRPQVDIDLYWGESSWALQIKDQGSGFSPEEVSDPMAPGKELQEHGRGILIMQRYSAELIYSDRGRCATLRMMLDSVEQ